MTLVFAGIQLSITKVPDAQKAEAERRYQELVVRVEQARHEALRQRMLDGQGIIN